MNAALAVAGDTIYVGSRVDSVPVAIVDASDPTAPAVVGEIAPPDEGLKGLSSRELRAVPDRDLLIVLNLACDAALHGCSPPAAETENLKLYDISDRRHPVLASTYEIRSSQFHQRSPHEMFVWRDDARVLIMLAAPPASPSYEVIDASDPHAPVKLADFDAAGAGLAGQGPDDILHSVSASPDGRTAYFSHQTAGLVAVDQSQLFDGTAQPVLSLLTPADAALDFSPPSTIGPHSAVKVPGRDVLVVTEEVYPMPYGTGCPWGHLRMVDAHDPAAMAIIGEYQLPENDPATCASHPTTAFTAHNATLTHDLALVSWYAGGLQVLDISDPTAPVQRAEFRADPIGPVAVEDPGLGTNPGMWSYPVVQGGVIWVVDIRNGLYALRYEGPFVDELEEARFLEGNSNVGDL